MISRTTDRFRRALSALPMSVQGQARAAYGHFQRDPYHPSLQFKRVHSRREIYSVRIGLDYRALGVVAGDEVVWFWVGPHTEYDQYLKRL